MRSLPRLHIRKSHADLAAFNVYAIKKIHIGKKDDDRVYKQTSRLRPIFQRQPGCRTCPFGNAGNLAPPNKA
jgi:hypothetical protein